MHTATSFPKTPREPAIDTLRGLACLALVSFHVVGDTPHSGLELPADHALALANALLADMRMPLFTFLSGFVFVALEHSRRTDAQLIEAKLRRLFLPLLSVGLLFWAAQYLTGRAPMPVYLVPLLPLGHFWFLQAVLLIMCSFILLRRITGLHSTHLAAALLGLSALFWLTGPRASLNLFSVNQAIYLMPFFMLGYLSAHIRRLDTNPKRLSTSHALTYLAITGALSAYAVLLWPDPDPVQRRALTLVIGTAVCLTLIAWAPKQAWLARIGGYSYAIYLFHVFFTASLQDALIYIAPDLTVGLRWAMGLMIGVTGPIIVQKALLHMPWSATFCLGLRAPIAAPRRGFSLKPAPKPALS